MRNAAIRSLLALLVFVAPAGAAAQSPADTVPRALWQHAAHNNWYVRVVGAGPDSAQGRVRYSGRQPRVGGHPLPEAIIRVDRQTEHDSGTLPGAATGFVVGALLGGAILSGLGETSSDAWDVMGPALGAGGFMAIVGMFAGNAVAPGYRVWEIVWPRLDNR